VSTIQLPPIEIGGLHIMSCGCFVDGVLSSCGHKQVIARVSSALYANLTFLALGPRGVSSTSKVTVSPSAMS
jgi:hypothetical protein